MREAVRRPPAGFLTTTQDLFTPAELDAITAYGEGLPLLKAHLTARKDEDTSHQRVTRIAWMERRPEIEWLHARIEQRVLDLNARFYRYDLYGLIEPFQYTIYDSGEGGHYHWHVDTNEAMETRKISLTLQLSEPAAYDGGDLILQAGDGPFLVEKTRGTLVAFPSYLMHRVTPVTAGIRKSLVIWVAGPPYR